MCPGRGETVAAYLRERLLRSCSSKIQHSIGSYKRSAQSNFCTSHYACGAPCPQIGLPSYMLAYGTALSIEILVRSASTEPWKVEIKKRAMMKYEFHNFFYSCTAHT